MAHCWVVLVEMVLKKCYLNTPLWRLADLVSRAHRSARFHKNSSLIALQQFPLKSFPWIVDVTHQFSLDKLVLQREFIPSSTSMLHLIIFLVLVHVLVTVRVLRASTQAFDRAQLSCLAGVCPSFLRSSVLHRFSRGSLHSRLSFRRLLCSRDLPLCGSGCFVDSRGAESIATPYPDVGCYRVPLCLQFLRSQSSLCGAESRPFVPSLEPWIAYQLQLVLL